MNYDQARDRSANIGSVARIICLALHYVTNCCCNSKSRLSGLFGCTFWHFLFTWRARFLLSGSAGSNSMLPGCVCARYVTSLSCLPSQILADMQWLSHHSKFVLPLPALIVAYWIRTNPRKDFVPSKHSNVFSALLRQ